MQQDFPLLPWIGLEEDAIKPQRRKRSKAGEVMIDDPGLMTPYQNLIQNRLAGEAL